MRHRPPQDKQQQAREGAPEPYHTGPPPEGSEWLNQYESRVVLGVLPGRGNAYLVRYRVSRGWPRRDEGECACSGTDWVRWVQNGGRRAGETTRG